MTWRRVSDCWNQKLNWYKIFFLLWIINNLDFRSAFSGVDMMDRLRTLKWDYVTKQSESAIRMRHSKTQNLNFLMKFTRFKFSQIIFVTDNLVTSNCRVTISDMYVDCRVPLTEVRWDYNKLQRPSNKVVQLMDVE